MIKRKLVQCCAAFLLSGIQSVAFAQSAQWCLGKPEYMLVDAGGLLMAHMSFRGDWIALCNVTTAYGSITPASCKSWQAMVQTAIVTQQPMIVFFGSAPACNSIGTYGSAPPVGYVLLQKQ